jgi:hypothetical protein
MPFAAIDEQKKEKFLTSAKNTLTRYAIERAGVTGFTVDKITGSGEAGANIYTANVKFNSAAEANRVFNSLGLVDKIEQNFDTERKQEYMKAAAAWTKGIDNKVQGGASVDYGTIESSSTDDTENCCNSASTRCRTL